MGTENAPSTELVETLQQRAGRRMHNARHTAIQRVLDKTGNLKAAQVLAGHATVGTTGDIYSGWETAQLEGTMREVLPA